MTRAKLTTILRYLKNAAALIDSAHLTAEKAKGEDIAKRLAALSRTTSAEITHIKDVRASLRPVSPR